MEVRFRSFEARDADPVRSFIKSLYIEDSEGQPMTDEKIDKTFSWLEKNTSAGNLMVFDRENTVIGYALLINYWSNEYGGNILHLDEIYIDKAFRGKGIAANFITYLAESRYGNSVAMQLEVMPSNEKAYLLYKKLGFTDDKNRVMFYRF